jgi:hypothetical protein
MRSLGLLILSTVVGAAVAALAACNGDKLAPPISNGQYDDPCDPNGGTGNTNTLVPVDAGAVPVALPNGSPGIGFDDLRFSATLGQLLVPAGRSGSLDLVDPSSEAVASIGGFSAQATFDGSDTFGVTSADEGGALVYVTDRTASTLSVIDPHKKTVVAHATLAAAPGYVRYVATTNEVWVTEPSKQQIEIFTPGATAAAAPTSAAVVAVPGGGGPESLAIDDTGKRAYTHTTAATVAIDLAGRAVAATWPNGCATSRGIAVDPAHGWVLSACEEGHVVVLDAHDGATIGSVTTGAGVDQIAYDAETLRAYVPSPTAGGVDVVQLAGNGMPKALGALDTAKDAHCVVTAGAGALFVCAPSQGALLFVKDPF